ncbi:MAG: CHAT domain-containing protein, partial [Desulfobulbaceae bacterium]|nr:CHAT domain-containing protein [Desulfobulbaceae bacterium]
MSLRYADLELSLRPTGGSEYIVDLRFRTPDSAVNAELLSGKPSRVQINFSELLALSLDTAAYGKKLTDTLFADPRLAHAFAQARTHAETADVPLRISLRLDVADDSLHALRWETLYDPDRGGSLFTSERILLTRYLDSPDLNPVTPKSEGVLRALISIANPTDLAKYQLTPINVVEELQRSAAALGDIPTRVLAREQNECPPTLNKIIEAIREGVDILYLVAHGTTHQGKPYLWLEDEDGSSVRIEGSELAGRIARLNTRPLLVVLASCESAGSSHGDYGLAALGPQLARAGIAAIVAMQGNVSMDTVARFMPTFFHELQRDGLVDRALAAARATVNDRLDWWMPVLFLRLRDGRLFESTVLPKPTCPYPGMVPFRSDDARFFYGREDEIRDLLHRLRNQRRILVTGPSGSGKSSLIYAGVLPKLPESTLFASHSWLVRHVRLSDHPLEALAESLESELTNIAGAVSRLLAKSAPAQRLLLVIDQFEEFFTLTDQEEHQQFVYALQELQRVPECTILLSMRADFYPDLMRSDLWDDYRDQRVEIVPLRNEALRTAIERPATQVGVLIEQDLLERLLADAANEPGLLPLVQETMVHLWDRMVGRRLTRAAYESLSRDGRSGLAVAIASRADGVIAEFSPAQRVIARRSLMRLIQFGEGRADTRRQQTIAALRSVGDDSLVFDRTLRALTESRLITISGKAESDERRADLSHDALITGWPTLQSWLRERREAEQTRRRLEEKAVEWVRLGCGRAGLLDDVEIGEAERWLESSVSVELGSSKDLSGLLQMSQTVIEEARQEREATQKREIKAAQALAEEQRKRADAEKREAEEQTQAANRLRTRNRIISAVGLIAVIAALVAVLFGFQSNQNLAQANQNAATAVAASNLRATAQAETIRERDEANYQRQVAISRQLASQAESIAADDLEKALLLSVEAYHHAETLEAKQSLFEVLNTTPQISAYLRNTTSGYVKSVYSPDGTLIASSDSNGIIALWDTTTRKPFSLPLVRHTEYVSDLVFSPDGTMLATGSYDKTIVLWDIKDHTHITIYETLKSSFPIESLAFSPSGQILASGDISGNLTFWNVKSKQKVDQLFAAHSSYITSLAFIIDDNTMASASYDGTIMLWDIETLQRIGEPLRGHEPGYASQYQDYVMDLAVSPDGKTLASGSADQTIILWDLATGEQIGQPLKGHNNTVNTVAFSPDGSILASAGADFTILLWDWRNEKTIGQPLKGHTSSIDSIAFAPDGKFLVSSDQSGQSILWDLNASHRLARSIQVPAGAWDVTFSPDGNMLASGGSDGKIVLWDVTNQKPLGVPLLGHQKDVASVAFSPDGRLLASCSIEGQMILWDVTTGKSIWKPSVFTNICSPLVFNPDGTILASSIGDSVYLWDMDGYQPISEPLSMHSERVTGVSFSPDGKILATSSLDKSVILWDITTRRPLGEPFKAPSALRRVAFSPTGKMLAASSQDGTVILWDIGETSSSRILVGHSASANDVAFSPDGTILASSSRDKTIILWNTATGRPIGKPLTGHTNTIGSVAFSPDGKILASSSPSGDPIILWNVLTKQRIASLDGGHTIPVFSVAIDRDGQIVASGTADGSIYLWDFATGQRISTFPRDSGHTMAVWGLAFSPDGKTLASSSSDYSIILWDVHKPETPVRIGKPLIKHTAEVVSLAFSPDGSTLASGSYDHTVILWNLTDIESPVVIQHPLEGHSSLVMDVVFSPDGKILASGGADNSVFLWDASTRQQIGHSLTGHTSWVRNVVFSPDGKTLVSSGLDKSILFWDVATQKLDGAPLMGHKVAITGLAFSPNGKLLASSSVDGELILWDVETRQEVGRLNLQGVEIDSLSFDPGSEALISGNWNGIINILNISPENWPDHACKLVHRNLPYFEWERYLPDEDYNQTCPGLAVDDYAFGDAFLQINSLYRSKDFQASAELHKMMLPWVLAMKNPWPSGVICATGSMSGFAAVVMPACEDSVSYANPKWKGYFQNDRGIARALTGDTAGAMEDLEAAVEWLKYNDMYDFYGERREAWIRKLEDGENPFDTATLEDLWNESQEIPGSSMGNRVLDVLPYKENFSDDSSGWPYSSAVAYDDGQYHIQSKSLYWASPGKVFGDFV